MHCCRCCSTERSTCTHCHQRRHRRGNVGVVQQHSLWPFPVADLCTARLCSIGLPPSPPPVHAAIQSPVPTVSRHILHQRLPTRQEPHWPVLLADAGRGAAGRRQIAGSPRIACASIFRQRRLDVLAVLGGDRHVGHPWHTWTRPPVGSACSVCNM
jgi:hypothetical protein